MDIIALAPKSPERIFPLEVWGLIFGQLNCESDLVNCYRTCKAWAELLKPKRTIFLFPKVLPIIYDYLLACKGQGGKNGESDNESDAEIGDKNDVSSEEELPPAILKMGLVSQFWTVYLYLQKYPISTDIGLNVNFFKFSLSREEVAFAEVHGSELTKNQF